MSIRISFKTTIPKRKKKTKSEWACIIATLGHGYINSQYWSKELRISVYSALIGKSKLRENKFSLPVMQSYPKVTSLFWREFAIMKEMHPEIKIPNWN